MRHQKAGKKLNRTGSHRDAMFRNMVTSLFIHGRVQTTDAKAKELRRWADQMITLAKRGDLHARRQALSVVRSKVVVHKLFEEASERFGQRAGGYTRVIKVGRRLGDSAPISIVEFVGPEGKKDTRKQKRKTAKKNGGESKRKGVTESEEKKAKESESQKKVTEQTASVKGEKAAEEKRDESAQETDAGPKDESASQAEKEEKGDNK